MHITPLSYVICAHTICKNIKYDQHFTWSVSKCCILRLLSFCCVILLDSFICSCNRIVHSWCGMLHIYAVTRSIVLSLLHQWCVRIWGGSMIVKHYGISCHNLAISLSYIICNLDISCVIDVTLCNLNKQWLHCYI